MDKEELRQILIDHGVPENQVEEMSDMFVKKEESRENITDNAYLAYLLQKETDWRKRAQLASASMSRNLGVD